MSWSISRLGLKAYAAVSVYQGNQRSQPRVVFPPPLCAGYNGRHETAEQGVSNRAAFDLPRVHGVFGDLRPNPLSAMTSDRKKPGVAFWATVALVVALVGYPLSFGPAFWWFSPPRSDGTWMMSHSDDPWAPKAYWPLGWLAEYGPEPVSHAIQWYVLLGVDRVWVTINPDGDRTCIRRLD
jgi:hypothetical protein